MTLTSSLAEAVLHSLPEAVFVRGDDCRLVYLNPAAERLIGRSAAEVVGRDFHEVLGDEPCRGGGECPLEAGLREGAPSPVGEGKLVTASGEVIAVRSSAAWVGPPGESRRLVVTVRPATAECRRQEEQLRRSRDTAWALLDATSDLALLLDADLTIIGANQALARSLGRPLPELVGTPALAHLPSDVAAGRRARMEQVLGSGAALCFEDQRDDRLFVNSVFPVLDDQGRVIRLAVFSQDVTERKRAEDAVRQSEARYRDLVETTSDWVWEVDANAAYTYASPRMRDILGYEPDEILGKTPFDLMPPEEATRVAGLFGPITARREAFARLENTNIHADGHLVVLETSGIPMFDPSGAFCGYRGMDRDVTERKQAERSLRESEQRFRALFEEANDGIMILDTSGRILDVNKATCRDLCYTRDELLGMAVADIDAPQAMRDSRERFEALLRAGHAVFETVVVRKDGTLLPVEVSLRVVSHAGTRAVLTIARDLTSRQVTEQAQRLAAVGELAAGVAHDFNNLLAAMMGRAEVAAQTGSEADYRKLVEIVGEGGARGAEICRNLLGFARPQPPNRAPMRIEEPIEAALALAERQTRNGEVTVNRRFRTGERPANADSGQLVQVFLNLFINACQAMPSGGELTVETNYRPQPDGPGEVVVTVSDTGTGIPPEHLARVFEPFFTTKGGRGQSTVPGTGLGLSVSHSIIAAHDGALEVHSTLGRGTSFTIRLPAHAEPVPAAVTAPAFRSDVPEAAGAGKSVLVAEDEEAVRSLIDRVLTSQGYRATLTASAREAADAVAGAKFDLVITDWLMPDGGGREVLAALRQLPDPPPVLLITGWADENLEGEAASLGAARCLQKPFSIDDLLATVGTLTVTAGRSN